MAISLITDVVWDQPPLGRKFGQVITQTLASYQVGAVVLASFTGANPRNNLRLEGTLRR